MKQNAGIENSKAQDRTAKQQRKEKQWSKTSGFGEGQVVFLHIETNQPKQNATNSSFLKNSFLDPKS